MTFRKKITTATLLSLFVLPALSTTGGCSSEPSKFAMPEADKVPQPSTEKGDTPDTAKMKHVKIK